MKNHLRSIWLLLNARTVIKLASWRADRKIKALNRPHYQSFYQLGSHPEKIDMASMQFGIVLVCALSVVGYFTFN